jgi:hypothetical protein
MSKNKIEAFKKDFEELCKEYNVQLSLKYKNVLIHDKNYKTLLLIAESKDQEYVILTKELN